MSGEALARHEDYWITLHRSGPVPTRTIVITFDGQPSGLDSEGFGSAFLRKAGYDTIHVAQKFGTQYQGLSVEAFTAVVESVLGGHEDVVTYGSSLGGYAALYYGGVVKARIIAAAPMFPAWPPLRNRAYAELHVTHGPLEDGAISPHAPAIIYDPMRQVDSRVVTDMVLPAYPSARLVKVPFGSHTVLMALDRARQLKPLIIGLISKDEIVPIEMPSEGTAIWHGEKGLYLRNTNVEAAVAELELSLAIRSTKRYFNELIKLLIKSGQVAVARDKLLAAMATDDKQLRLVPSMRSMVLAAGLPVDLRGQHPDGFPARSIEQDH